MNGQVNVELWPIKMVGCWRFDIRQLADGCLSEPWEVLEREKQFFVIEQQPKAVLRYMGDLRG